MAKNSNNGMSDSEKGKLYGAYLAADKAVRDAQEALVAAQAQRSAHCEALVRGLDLVEEKTVKGKNVEKLLGFRLGKWAGAGQGEVFFPMRRGDTWFLRRAGEPAVQDR